MTLFWRENLVNGLRWAVVLGGLGLGLVLPPLANASGAASPTEPTESFASLAQWHGTFATEPPSQPWQYSSDGEFDPQTQANASDFAWAGGPTKYSNSFGQASSDHHWDHWGNGSGYWQGEGWRPFHGGGWWHEHWHCEECGKTSSPVPESSTSIMLIVGLLALVVMFGRQGKHPLVRLR